MRARTCAVVAIGLLTIADVDQVSAQTAAQRRFRISANAGVQPSTNSFDSSMPQPVYLESSVIQTTYKVADGLLVDGGADFMFARSFGVGVAVSWFSKTNDGAVNAAIPHPFFFRAPRSITGTASGLRRDELVTHVQAVYVIRPTATIDVTLAAGPSFFKVNQAFVYDVSYNDSYPYDSPVFTAARSQQVSSRKTGFNASADIGMRVSPTIGIGGLVRFSKAAMVFVLPNGSATTRADAGGIQVAGGIRLYF